MRKWKGKRSMVRTLSEASGKCIGYPYDAGYFENASAGI